MSRRRAAYILVAVGGLWTALYGGPNGLGVLVVGIILVSLAAFLSFVYLVRIYRRLTPPRPVFYRMLLDAQVTKLTLAGWIGYLTISRITRTLQEDGWIEWSIPSPPPEQSAPLSALVVIVALLPPSYYALTIWLARRRAARRRSEDRVG